jgi:hypothetical protein
VLLVGQVPDGQQREADAVTGVVAGVLDRLGRRHLHRLLGVHQPGLDVAGDNHQDRAYERHAGIPGEVVLIVDDDLAAALEV